MGRKIAIVGTTDHWRDAPKGQGWERWVCHYSSLEHDELQPIARVYELHDKLTRDAVCVNALRPSKRNFGEQVWSFYPDPAWGAPRVLDAERLAAVFGRYFTNSVAWMIGHALFEHSLGGTVDEIGVFGVDMATSKEYGHERPSVEYFLGWARGAGIKVTLPDTCDLLHCGNLYGLARETWYEHKLFAERRRITLDLRALDPEQHPYTVHALEATLAEIDYLLRVQFHTPEGETECSTS